MASENTSAAGISRGREAYDGRIMRSRKMEGEEGGDQRHRLRNCRDERDANHYNIHPHSNTDTWDEVDRGEGGQWTEVRRGEDGRRMNEKGGEKKKKRTLARQQFCF